MPSIPIHSMHCLAIPIPQRVCIPKESDIIRQHPSSLSVPSPLPFLTSTAPPLYLSLSDHFFSPIPSHPIPFALDLSSSIVFIPYYFLSHVYIFQPVQSRGMPVSCGTNTSSTKSKLKPIRFFTGMFALLHKTPGKVAAGRISEDPEALPSGAMVSSTSTDSTEEAGRSGAQDEQEVDDSGLVHARPAATRRAVKQLHFGVPEERIAAVAEIRRLAAGDPRRKRSMADLGVVQPLVSMLDELKDDRGRRLVVEALSELANGTFRNKTQMVEAGLLPKLRNLAERSDASTNVALAQLLCSISSLAKTQFPIAPYHHMLPFFVETLRGKEASDDMKLTCLATLHNLSIKLDNIRDIVAGGAVEVLLALSQNKKLSEGALLTLGNLVLSELGKKAIDEAPMTPECLIEAMAWDDMPKAQELAAYLLMVVAHRSKLQRQRMADLGVVPLLIRVALLGSPIAQKRAVKMLPWFKRGGIDAKLGGHSGPQPTKMYSTPSSAVVDGKDVRECRLAIKRMVKQSLDRNMENIVRRAHASWEEDFASGFKSLVGTSSSKSLPY